MQLPDRIERKIEAIAADNTSGATELAAQAGETLAALTDAEEIVSAAALRSLTIEAAGALVAAQPSMAPLFNLANETLLALPEDGPLEATRRAIRVTCEQYVRRLNHAQPAIAEEARRLIDEGATVFTYSYSSTVLRALLMTHAAGTPFDVICTEARPVGEGATLAEKLGREGIAVRLLIDIAAFSFLAEADVVFVGADTISSEGLVNKIGTSALVRAAHDAGLAVYALCSTAKILPAGISPRPPIQKPPDEILDTHPPNVTPINYYFDLTPASLEMFTGIVTEDGLMTPRELTQRAQQQGVHPRLERLLLA